MAIDYHLPALVAHVRAEHRDITNLVYAKYGIGAVAALDAPAPPARYVVNRAHALPDASERSWYEEGVWVWPSRRL